MRRRSPARRGRSPRRAGGADAGQATVEAVLVVPFVVLAALLIVQVGQVVHGQLLVVHAAREAARAAAVAGGHLDEATVPGLRGGLDGQRLEIRTSGVDDLGLVEVQLRYRHPTDVALVGALVPDVTLTASVAMRAER